MTPPVSIRVADAASDTAAMLEIYAHSIATSVATFETETPPVEDFEQRVSNTLTMYPWLVAELDGRVVGYAYAHQHHPRPGYCWTAEISCYVAPSCAGSGIGTTLYSKLIDVLKFQGFKNLLAIISIPNPASEALHQKMGFSKAGQFNAIGYKFGQWQQTCWWQAQIGELDDSPTDPVPFSDLRSGDVLSLLN